MTFVIKLTSPGTSSSKRQKHFHEPKTGKCEDRISCLTTEVLCHILSYLPTKYAVGTSILSSRWMYVWASVSNMNFDDELLFLPSKDFDDKNCHFINFVDRVLMLRKASSLQKFRLKCTREYDLSRVNLWISSAIIHEVKELEICLSMKTSLLLPRSVFDCKALVVLKLSDNLEISCPTSIWFPNLKILHLCSLSCLDDDSVKKFIVGCPVLEELNITRVILDNIQSIHVESSTLRRLFIYFAIASPKDHKYSVAIEAPSLELINLGDYISEEFNVNELSHLSEAYLSVGQIYRQSTPSDEFAASVTYLLWKISNVKRLRLSHHIEKSISLARAAGSCLSLYHNLTYLEVEVDGSWQFAFDLLRVSPSLQVLICTKVKRCTLIAKGPSVPYCCTLKTPDSVPSCFFSRLERIQINGFDGCQVEKKLVEFILKNAKFLQNMKIVSHKIDLMLQSSILKELLLFPRGSTSCQIEYV